ncbi:hypothetical protein LT493_23845 [Streptomyces tricolor]|nr:hypothetical protein [Streptomyces tricolor]
MTADFTLKNGGAGRGGRGPRQAGRERRGQAGPDPAHRQGHQAHRPGRCRRAGHGRTHKRLLRRCGDGRRRVRRGRPRRQDLPEAASDHAGRGRADVASAW